jgi:hypothetical protein
VALIFLVIYILDQNAFFKFYITVYNPNMYPKEKSNKLRNIFSLSLSLFPVAPTLEHRASVELFVSLHFLNPKTVGRIPWTSQGRYLHKTTQTQNKRRQTTMPLVGFEPTIPVFERAKIVHHALGRTATVIGKKPITRLHY